MFPLSWLCRAEVLCVSTYSKHCMQVASDEGPDQEEEEEEHVELDPELAGMEQKLLDLLSGVDNLDEETDDL